MTALPNSITNSLTGQGHTETVKIEWQVQSVRNTTEMVVKCQQLLSGCFISDIDYWKVNWLLTSFFFSGSGWILPAFYLPIQNAGMGWDCPLGGCPGPTSWERHSMAFPGWTGTWTGKKSPRKAACQMDPSPKLPGFGPVPCSQASLFCLEHLRGPLGWAWNCAPLVPFPRRSEIQSMATYCVASRNWLSSGPADQWGFPWGASFWSLAGHTPVEVRQWIFRGLFVNSVNLRQSSVKCILGYRLGIFKDRHLH